MADIPSSRNVIQQEEVRYKASVSEATLTRIGASLNFVMDKIYTPLEFDWSGYYKVTSISDGMNGRRYFKDTVDIYYYVLTNDVAGSSGTSSINFEVYDDTGALLGDLFSVAPSISSGAGAGAVIGRDVENATDIESGANKVVGTLNYTTLNTRWSIKPKLTAGQTDGRNLHFSLIVKEQ